MRTKLTKAVLLIAILALVVMCFVACGNTKTFSVTIMDGETELATLSVADGATVDFSGKVAKDGYVLKGLFYDAEFKQAFNTENEITGDLLLYAKFEKVTYTITVKSNGGSDVAPVTVAPGATYTLTAPERAGYTFLGYTYVDDNDEDQPFPLTGTYNIDGNTRVYAQWAINTYSVTLRDGISATPTVLSVEYGKKAAFPADPTKAGNTFTGWFEENATTAFDKNAAITANVALTARYSVNSYKIFVTTNGGSAIDDITVEYGAEYQIPSPSKAGYAFAGYTYTNDEGVQAFPQRGNYTFDKNTRVTAQWTINTYTVTLNDGISAAPTVLTVEYGKTAVFPADPTKAGNTFTGWFKDGATVKFDKLTAITEDVTLTARYSVNSYTITASNYEFTQQVEYGAAYTLPTKAAVLEEKAGVWSDFNGWLVNGQLVDYTGTYSWTTDIIVTADYVRDPMYLKSTVSFFDGTRLMGSIIVDDGDTVASKIGTINTAKTGYEFVKWHEENTDEAFDANTVINADLNLYAIYNANNYTITIIPNGGTGTTLYNVTYGSAYGLAALTKTGYSFDKYLDNENEEFDLTGTYEIAGSIVLNATYTRNTVTVTFYQEDESLWQGAELFQYQTLTDAAVATPEKIGYTFSHWSTTKDGADYGMDTPIEKDIEALYPVYTANVYKITMVLNGGEGATSVNVPYGAVPSIVAPTKKGYDFTGWLYNETDPFDPTAVYLTAGNIEISAGWLKDEQAFVREDNYFKERDNSEDEYTFVFLTDYTYDFSGQSISTTDGGEYFDFTDGEHTVMKMKKATPDGTTFSLTVGDKTRQARVVKNVYIMGTGSVYNQMIANIDESDLFMTTIANQNDYVMDAGREDFRPDITAKTKKDGNYYEMTFADAYLQIARVESLTDHQDYTSECSIDGTVINFSDELPLNDVYAVEISSKYAPNDITTITLKVRLNDGVNVYNNVELKAAYADTNVRKINILRNIDAELADDEYYLDRGGHGRSTETITIRKGETTKTLTVDGGTPYNDFGHSVYVRDVMSGDDSVVINGNYFSINGSKLPYIDNSHDNYGAEGSKYTTGNSNRIANVQVGIFLYRCADLKSPTGVSRKYVDGTVSMNNLRITGNYIPEYQDYEQDLGDGGLPLLKMSAAYIGVIVRGGTMNMDNVSITETGMGFMLHGGVSGYDEPGKIDGIKGQTQPGETQACVLNFANSMIDLSWANGIYAFDLCTMNLTHSKIGRSCGAAIHADDRPYTMNGIPVEQALSLGYSELSTKLLLDRYTADNIKNWVIGTEAWFVAYNMSKLATDTKGDIQDQVTAATGGVMQFVKNDDGEKMNFAIIVKETEVTGWDTTERERDVHHGPSLDLTIVDGGFSFFYHDQDELMTMAAELLPELAQYTDAVQKGQDATALYAQLMSIGNDVDDGDTTGGEGRDTFTEWFGYMNDQFIDYGTAAYTQNAEGMATAMANITNAQMQMLLKYYTYKVTSYGKNLGSSNLAGAVNDFNTLMALGRPYVVNGVGFIKVAFPVYYAHEVA